MHKDAIRKLKCPYCKSGFTLYADYKSSVKTLIHGILSCNCAKVPVVNGITFLVKGRYQNLVLLFVGKERHNLIKYKEIPFFLFRFPRGNKLLVLLVSLLSRHNIFKKLSFSQFIGLLYTLRIINKDWKSYLANRRLREDFFAAKVLLKGFKKGSFLDAGSGSGHLSALLAMRTKSTNIFSLDYSLINIYIAKKYISPGANILYSDLNSPLPFEESLFDHIFCNDTFHYVKKQAELSKEFVRLLKKKGSVILTNLHNKKFMNEYSDPLHYPQTLQKYISFFPNLKPLFFGVDFKNKSLTEHPNRDPIPVSANLKFLNIVFER